MPRSGATQALSFVDVVWKIWKEPADDISRPGNAFSLASLRILDIVSTSDSFRKEERGGPCASKGDGPKKHVIVR